MKRHLVNMNVINRTLKTGLWFFVISKTDTLRKLKKRRKDSFGRITSPHCSTVVSLVNLNREDKFGEQLIGFGGFVKWPLRSPDLIAMDFFLPETASLCDRSANISGTPSKHYG